MRVKKIFKTLTIIFLVFLIFLSLNKFFYQQIKNTAFLISEPLDKFFWQSQNKLSQFLEPIFKNKELKTENEEFKKENFFLKSKLLELKALRKENAELRKILEFGIKKDFDLIFAQVISKDISEDSILVNKGKKDGVEEGMAAITESKVLVGKVGEVFGDYAQVLLISKKDFTFPVKVNRLNKKEGEFSEENEISGIARGKGNFKVAIELLPKDVQIEKEDIVSTTLLGNIFPEDLLVGEIEEIKKSDPEPFQQGKIKPYFRELTLEDLFLIKQK